MFRTINKRPTFIKVVTWILIVVFVAMQSPALLYADSTPRRFAVNKSVPYPVAEEDNVNIPFYGYVDSYRVTATIPTYYPLQAGQAEKCAPDWTGFQPHPPVQVFFYDATQKKLLQSLRGVGSLGKWWRDAYAFDGGGVADMGQYVSYASPPSGAGSVAYVAYYDAVGHDLRYVAKTGGQVTDPFNAPVTLDASGDVGKYATLQLDGQNQPHIAYYDATAGNLKYVEGPAFAPTTIDASANDVGQYASLAVDPAGAVHVAYYDATAGDLKYIYKPAGGAWQAPVVVDSAGDVGRYASIDVDSAGKIYIAYYQFNSSTSGALKFATKSGAGGAWTTATVDSTGNAGQYCRIAVNHAAGSNAKIHIAYYDAAAAKLDLKYAWKKGTGAWTLETVDTVGDVGRGIDLKIYSFPNDARHNLFDAPFVTYYDASNGDLKFNIRTEGVGWGTPEVVASAGDVGAYSALAFTEWYPPLDANPFVTFDNGSVNISCQRIPGWWIKPPMDVQVVGGQTATNVSLVTVLKRLPDQEQWAQILALYSSSHMRPLPFPYDYMNSVCFGNSVLLGDATEDEWPHADIRKLVINPVAESMDVYLYDGGHSHVAWHAERGKAVFDVTDISTDTLSHPFSTIRAMFVEDNKAVFSKVQAENEPGGPYKILPPYDSTKPNDPANGLWAYNTSLKGDWWKLFRDKYTLYNTSNPDVLMEVLGPLGCYIARQAESNNSVSGIAVVNKSSASGGQTIKSSGASGVATYQVTPAQVISNASVTVRYSDDVGGGTIGAYLTGGSTDRFTTARSDTTNDYLKSRQLALGADLQTGQTYNVNLQIVPGAAHPDVDFLAVEQGQAIPPIRTWGDVWNGAVWFTSSTGAQYVADRNNPEQNHSTVANQIQGAIKIQYDKAKGDNVGEQQNGKFALLMQPTDLGAKDYLSFWVYNNGAPLTIRVRFEDTTGGSWETILAGVPDPSMMTAAADWENLVVDLSRTFGSAGTINMHAVSKILFTADPGNTTSKGSFWMDDFALLSAPAEAPLDVLERDFYGWSTAIGSAFSLGLSSNAFHNAGGVNDLGQRSLAVSWTYKDLTPHNIVYNFRSDVNTNSPWPYVAIAPPARIGNYTNLTVAGNNAVSIWVKSDGDNNFAVGAKIYDDIPGVNDATGGAQGGDPGHALDMGSKTYTGGGQWQKLSWYYGSAAEAQNAKQLYFFPLAGEGRSTPGIVYFDDLNLEQQPAPANAPYYQQFMDWINGVIDQMNDTQKDIAAALAAATAASVAVVIVDFIRDYLAGFTMVKQDVENFRDHFTGWVNAHPTASYWGAIHGFGVVTAATFWESMDSFGDAALGLKFGLFLAYQIAMTNVAKVLIPKTLAAMTSNYILRELDFSPANGGIPAQYKTVVLYPYYESKPAKVAENIVPGLEKTWLANPDPNIQLWVLLNGAPDSAQDAVWSAVYAEIQKLKAKYGDHFGAIRATKLHWNPKLQAWRQWWVKPGAVDTLMAWLVQDVKRLQTPIAATADEPWVHNRIAAADTVPFEVGLKCAFDACYIPGGFSLQPGGHGVVPAGLVNNVFALMTYDTANFDLASVNAAGHPVGGLTRMIGKMVHPDNYDPNLPLDQQFKHAAFQPMLQPDPAVIGSPDETLWAQAMAREQARMAFTARALANVFRGGTDYGKVLVPLHAGYHMMEGKIPDILMSHDIIDGTLLRCALILDCFSADDFPPNALAMFVRDGRWTFGDILNLTTRSIWPGNWGIFKDKLPRVPQGTVQFTQGWGNSFKVIENVRGRLGDPALLFFWLGMTAAKFFPGVIQISDPNTMTALFWGTLIALIGAPKFIGIKSKGEAILATQDTLATTLCLLPNTIHQTWSLFQAIQKLLSGNVLDPEWKTAASQAGGITLKQVMDYNMLGMAVAATIAFSGVATGHFSWPEIIPLVSLGGGGSFLTWLYSKSPNEIAAAGGWLKMTQDEVVRMLKEYATQFPQQLGQIASSIDQFGVPKDGVSETFTTDFIKTTYMYEGGASIQLTYVDPQTAVETVVGSISFKLINGQLQITGCSVAANAAALTGGVLSPDQVAYQLLLQAYSRISALKPPTTTLSIQASLLANGGAPTALANALQPLLNDAYIVGAGPSPDGVFQNYFITDKMRGGVPPNLPPATGSPRPLIVLGAETRTAFQNQLSSSYRSLFGVNESLLPIDGIPALERIIDAAQKASSMGDIYIATSQAVVPGAPLNKPFAEQIYTWLLQNMASSVSVTYKSDGSIDTLTTTLGTRTLKVFNVGAPGGAVADLKYVLDHAGVAGDFFVLDGHSLFTDLDIGQLAALSTAAGGSSVVGAYQVSGALASTYDQVILSGNLVTGVLAPGTAAQSGSLASVPALYLNSSSIALVGQYLAASQPADNLGSLLRFFLQKGLPLHGYTVPGTWSDLASIANLNKANATYFVRQSTTTQQLIQQALQQGSLELGQRVDAGGLTLSRRELANASGIVRVQLTLSHNVAGVDTPWATLTFSLHNLTQVNIEDFQVLTGAQGDQVALAKALVAHAYTFSKLYAGSAALQTLVIEKQNIIFPTGSPLRSAIDQLTGAGYLSVSGANYAFTSTSVSAKYLTPPTVELMVLDADTRAILNLALSGVGASGLILSGDPASPTLSIGGVKLIDAGKFLGSNFKLLADGTIEITAADGTLYKTTLTALLSAVNQAYGQSSLTFNYFPGTGSPTVIALAATGVTWNGKVLPLPGGDVGYINFTKVIPGADFESASALIMAQVGANTTAEAQSLVTLGGGAAPENIKYMLQILNADATTAHPSLPVKIAFQNGLEVSLTWNDLRSVLPSGVLKLLNDKGGPPAGFVTLTGEPGVYQVGGAAIDLPKIPANIDLPQILADDVAELSRGMQGAPADVQQAYLDWVKGMQTEFWVMPKEGRMVIVRKGIASWDEGPLGWITRNRVDGIVEINANNGEAQVIINSMITPTDAGLKKLVVRFMEFMSRPGMATATIGVSTVVSMLVNFSDGKYHPTDEWMGDVFGAAVLSGEQELINFGMRRLAVSMAERGAAVGLGAGFITAIPLIILSDLTFNYAQAFYRQWSAQTGFLNVSDISASPVSDSAYRAWLVTLNQISQGWRYLFSPNASVMKAALQDEIARQLMAQWALTAEGAHAYAVLSAAKPSDFGYVQGGRPGTQVPTIAQAASNLVKDRQYQAEQLASVYLIKYQDDVLNPLLDGLAFGTGCLPQGGLGCLAYDEYGWLGSRNALFSSASDYALVYPANTTKTLPVFVPQQAMKDMMIRKVFTLWDTWAHGESGLQPLAYYTGYTPTLEDIRLWVCQDIASIRMAFVNQWIDGTVHSFPLNASMPSFVWNAATARALDCRTAVAMCDSLITELLTADFTKYGYYDTLLPNPGYETLDSYVLTNSLQQVTTNFVSLTATQTMRGVRYWWDVQGHNAAGWGPKSEQRNFIPTTAP